MTVIAFDGKIIAADGIITGGTYIVANNKEKLLLHDGYIYSCAGMLQDMNDFFEWIKKGKGNDIKPSLDNGFEGVKICLFTRKIFVYFNKLTEIPFDSKVFSGGCGEVPAHAALKMGADAIKAVKIACELNTNCGGKITAYNLETKEWIDVD